MSQIFGGFHKNNLYFIKKSISNCYSSKDKENSILIYMICFSKNFYKNIFLFIENNKQKHFELHDFLIYCTFFNINKKKNRIKNNKKIPKIKLEVRVKTFSRLDKHSTNFVIERF